ncbi:M20 family peptidase [Dyella sp. ASV21]|uniref:M20 family peptidase n=1 Tax=Dyella sp. ASV21 TaxID=2795114 RepID=UPI0018EBEA05|nr:M20 family peptidase [Dyella sp. ASV21]
MKNVVKVALGLVLLVVLAVAAVVLLRTWATPPLAAADAKGSYTPLKFDQDQAVARFAGAVKLHTVSTGEAPPSTEDLAAFHAYLAEQFPRVHHALQVEEVGHGGLLITWKGQDTSVAPVILMAHQDTVPVDPDTRARWTRDPWSGEVSDGVIWGRGALDDKASVVSILEAAEQLLQQGFEPRRTLYFAFGSDEERGGEGGAVAIVALLKQRGVHAQLVLDEGGAYTNGLMPGVAGDLAMVGIAEKGYVSVKLSVQAAGGHSSQPPPQSAIGILSHALVQLEAKQMPAKLAPTATAMFDALAPLLPFPARMAVRNRWLLGSVLIGELEKTPSGNAMVRTTTAETTFNAGVKDNVLPTVANATINFRILPGDTVAGVLEHVRRVVADPRVTIEPGQEQNEPSPTSPIDGEGLKLVRQTIQQVSPGVPVVPYLVTAATDASHYVPVSTEQLRFVPYHLTPTTIQRFHGIDEGIPVSDYLNCVQFAAQFMRNAAG